MAIVKELKRPAVTLRKLRSLDDLVALEGPKAVVAVKDGLNAGFVRQLAEELDLGLEDLAVPLRLKTRTLHRRLEQGRLDVDESERLLALVRILAHARVVLGSREKAVHWLKSPLPTLGGQAPLQCAETQIGLREVEDVLTRIEDGVLA